MNKKEEKEKKEAPKKKAYGEKRKEKKSKEPTKPLMKETRPATTIWTNI